MKIMKKFSIIFWLISVPLSKKLYSELLIEPVVESMQILICVKYRGIYYLCR